MGVFEVAEMSRYMYIEQKENYTYSIYVIHDDDSDQVVAA